MTPQTALELQLTDTAIDQLQHRLPRLPDVVAAAAAHAEIAAWSAREATLLATIEHHQGVIAEAEASSAALTTQRVRLEAQLKTVIAPREAEALMHEIATLTEKRSAFDDQELEAMEGVAAAETELAEHRAGEPALRAAAADKDAAADAAKAGANAELATLAATRDGLRSQLPVEFLRQYDTMRGQHDGVAIAKLNGMQCDGCHLDMSRAEVDDVKRLPDDEFGECPNCGRLLAR